MTVFDLIDQDLGLREMLGHCFMFIPWHTQLQNEVLQIVRHKIFSSFWLYKDEQSLQILH